MVDSRADDALAGRRPLAAARTRVEQVVVCTPDKDSRSVCAATASSSSTGARAALRNEWAVHQKFGVAPGSIPDCSRSWATARMGFAGWTRLGACPRDPIRPRRPRAEPVGMMRARPPNF